MYGVGVWTLPRIAPDGLSGVNHIQLLPVVTALVWVWMALFTMKNYDNLIYARPGVLKLPLLPDVHFWRIFESRTGKDRYSHYCLESLTNWGITGIHGSSPIVHRK